MKYNILKSIILSGKETPHILKTPTDSFQISSGGGRYIEPTFMKEDSDAEKPVILLISAVGATGKSALARKLSEDTQMPLLDLGRNKPVGDNSLSGILMHSFDPTVVGRVIDGLSSGSYGLIIDGIDEGLSKTNSDSFEAFLDDIYNLGKSAGATSFILLGRSQALEECWVYFKDKGLTTGLFSINPFDIEGARNYIDTFTDGVRSAHVKEYEVVREFIIEKLKVAFSGDKKDGFMSFIGYPPVLDAIVTLLNEEKNYHRLMEDLLPGAQNDVEVRLLKRVAEYILRREREEKVLQNIVRPLFEGKPAAIRDVALREAFSDLEQAKRLLSICIDKPVTIDICNVPLINEKYEEQLVGFLKEHPFLNGKSFRNPVFEAVALSLIIGSNSSEFDERIDQYSSTHKHHYHLVNMLGTFDGDIRVGPRNINVIVQSSMEFAARGSDVRVDVDGQQYDEDFEGELDDAEIEIEVVTNDKGDDVKTFVFHTHVSRDVQINLGPKLQGVNITVPCDIGFCGGQEVEMIAPIFIEAKCIHLNTKALVLRTYNGDGVQLIAGKANSVLEKITPNHVRFEVILADKEGLYWPLAEYVVKRTPLPSDVNLRNKYFRVRKILMSFRSHSKGAFKRYQDKIKHKRMLKNEVGKSVLRQLLTDNILLEDGKFYTLDSGKLNEYLGVSWQDLRKGEMPEKLMAYLRSITVGR